jgi:adenylate kinase family enzyme
MLRDHPRIVVVGTSCSGKTTFARALAKILGRPHIELDALHWGPNWSYMLDFVDAVASGVAADEWIVDGNYRRAGHVVWPRASAAVWLNYPFPLVFGRSLARTVGRILSGELVYSGNRETFRKAFLSFDGIPWWVIRTYRHRRREYPRFFMDRPHIQVFEYRSPREAARALAQEAAGHLTGSE